MQYFDQAISFFQSFECFFFEISNPIAISSYISHTGSGSRKFSNGSCNRSYSLSLPKRGSWHPPPPFMTRLQWFVTNIQTGRVWGCYNAMIPSLCIDCNLFNRIKMFQTLYWHPCSEGNTESSVNWKCLKCICLKSIR